MQTIFKSEQKLGESINCPAKKTEIVPQYVINLRASRVIVWRVNVFDDLKKCSNILWQVPCENRHDVMEKLNVFGKKSDLKLDHDLTNQSVEIQSLNF